MRIGIDIDDTITNTQAKIDELALKDGFKIYDRTKHWFYDRYNQSMDVDEAFLRKHVIEMMKEATIKDGVSEYISKLKEDGHQIYIVTARSTYYDSTIPDITIEYLEKNNVKYDKIILACRDKAMVCLDNRIDILVDDSIENITNVEEVGIKTITLDNEYNKEIKTTRAKNWKEVYEIISGR